jgi:hypothetical protein
MTVEEEIEQLRRERDAEWARLKGQVAQTQARVSEKLAHVSEVLDPKVQLRKHIWLAVGVALAGGLVLAPSLRRKRSEGKSRRGHDLLKMLRPILMNIPVLKNLLPMLDEATSAAPAAGGGNPEAVSEDYGREEEEVRPFGVMPNAAAEETPVTSDKAAYRGYSGRSNGAGHAGNGRHEIGDALKAALILGIAETAAHINWEKVAEGVQGLVAGAIGRKESANGTEGFSGRLAGEGTL